MLPRFLRPLWWLPNLFLLLYPFWFLPGMMRDRASCVDNKEE